MNKKNLLFLSLLCVCFSAMAQTFPTTEKEVSDLLCKGKWEVTEMGEENKMRKIKVMGIEMNMQFLRDNTYTGEINGVAKGGRWELDMPNKQVKMFEESPTEPTSYIRELAADRLLIVMAKEDQRGRIIRMVLQRIQ